MKNLITKKLSIKKINSIKKTINLIFSQRENILKLFKKKKITSFFFYNLTSLLTSQSRSCLWEKYLIYYLNGKKTSKRGDVIINKKNYEIKISGVNQNNALHIVQIRLWEHVNYIVQFIDIKNNYKSYLFFLTHENMKFELNYNKSTSAHGNKKSIKKNKNIELRFTIKNFITSKEFIKWKDKYLKKIF